MKIKYLSGPKAGQESHVENSIGRALIDSGLAELIEKDNALPKPYQRGGLEPPEWEVLVIQNTTADSRFLAIKMSVLGQVTIYSGEPTRIRLIGGHQPPKEIIALYARKYAASPSLRDPHAAHQPPQPSDENKLAGISKANADERLRQNELQMRTDLLAGRGASLDVMPKAFRGWPEEV